MPFCTPISSETASGMRSPDPSFLKQFPSLRTHPHRTGRPVFEGIFREPIAKVKNLPSWLCRSSQHCSRLREASSDLVLELSDLGSPAWHSSSTCLHVLLCVQASLVTRVQCSECKRHALQAFERICLDCVIHDLSPLPSVILPMIPNAS